MKVSLEEYIKNCKELDVVEVRNSYKVADSEIEAAVMNLRRAGIPVVFYGGKIKRILNKQQYEQALFEERLERRGLKVNGIEYR